MNGLARFVVAVDWLNERVGRVVAWAALAMVAITFAVVVLRYGFALGWVWVQETYVWLHGVVFMLGAGYTLLHNEHVRIDIVYAQAGYRYRAWVDMLGVLLLLLPTVGVVAWVSWPYVVESWSRLEESREAGGLPGLFLLKSAILGFCLLVALQGLSLAGRALLTLRRHPGFAPGGEARAER